jgi:hypothetical protein
MNTLDALPLNHNRKIDIYYPFIRNGDDPSTHTKS